MAGANDANNDPIDPIDLADKDDLNDSSDNFGRHSSVGSFEANESNAFGWFIDDDDLGLQNLFDPLEKNESNPSKL